MAVLPLRHSRHNGENEQDTTRITRVNYGVPLILTWGNIPEVNHIVRINKDCRLNSLLSRINEPTSENCNRLHSPIRPVVPPCITNFCAFVSNQLKYLNVTKPDSFLVCGT